MSGDLFVRKTHSETIERFRDKFSEVLSMKPGQHRFSDNHAEGIYFYTDCLGIRVQIEAADDPEVTDYDYHVHFRGLVQRLAKEGAIMEGIADLVAAELTRAGFTVLRLSPNLDGASGRRVRRRCELTNDGSSVRFIEEQLGSS